MAEVIVGRATQESWRLPVIDAGVAERAVQDHLAVEGFDSLHNSRRAAYLIMDRLGLRGSLPLLDIEREIEVISDEFISDLFGDDPLDSIPGV
jgi:hypothetical protein